MTRAVVMGLELYGPHVLGFVLFAIPAAGLTAVGYLLFGEKVAASIAGAVLSLGFGTLLRHAWLARTTRPNRKG